MQKHIAVTIASILTFVATCLYSQEKNLSKDPKDSVYFGPVIKSNILGIGYYMPQLLTSVEYFVHTRISLQQSFGPMIKFKKADIENPVFRDYKGFGIGNEIRYYVNNNA